MKLTVKTRTGEILTIHLQQQETPYYVTDVSSPTLKLHQLHDNANTQAFWFVKHNTKFPLPSEIILAIFTYCDAKQVICYLSLVCKEWLQAASHNELWHFILAQECSKNAFLPIPAPFLMQQGHVKFRHLYVHTKQRMQCIEQVWDKLKSQSSKSTVANLNDACTSVELDKLEAKLKCTLPFDVRASLCVHNGEQASAMTAFGMGVAGFHGDAGILQTQARLLSIDEIAKAAEEENFDSCIVYGKTDWINPLDAKRMRLVPLTSSNHTIMYCVDVHTGNIYVRSGMFTLYYNRDSWLEFLWNVMDIIVTSRKFPDAPF